MFNLNQPNVFSMGGGQPLEDGISQNADAILQHYVNGNQLDRFVAGNIAMSIRANLSQIAQQLRQNANRFGRTQVTAEEIQQAIVALISQSVQRQQPQQTQLFPSGQFTAPTPMMNMNQPIAIQPTGSYMDDPNAYQQTTQQPAMTQQTIQQPAQAQQTTQLGLQIYAESLDPHIVFDQMVDSNYLSFSTKSDKSGPIVNITSKSVLVNTMTSESFNFTSANCEIPEPCPSYVIRNFIETNPRLVADKYIIDLSYRLFILKKFKFQQGAEIDLSSFSNAGDLPELEVVRSVIDSINSLTKTVADSVDKLITYEFNDLIHRFIKTSTMIDKELTVSELSDVYDMLDPQKTWYDFTSMTNYRKKVLECFMVAVRRVIFESTRRGYYDPASIAKDLIVSPRFVIRENHLYEREADFSDPKFIEAVKLRYSVFGLKSDIVVANFIPGDLENDLNQTMFLTFNPSTDFNPFIYLLSKVWKHRPKTIVINAPDNRKLTFKNGMTLDGKPFIFKDESVELNYGL